MEKTNRRKFITNSALASIAAVGGFRNVSAISASVPVESHSVSIIANAPSKSKRDLMMQVLDMSSTPGYIPAGFFMHFGVKGDAAIKSHLEYFRATGMDFLKIQFDELKTGLKCPFFLKNGLSLPSIFLKILSRRSKVKQ
jgi:hypothetical protein